MINKKLLATLIAATFAAPVAVYAKGDGPTVYGKLHLGIEHDDTDEKGGRLDVKTNSSRFGIRGDTDLGNGLNVFYRYEFQVDADTANIQDNNRLSFVGVEVGDSKISIGKQWSAMFNHVGTFMDITQAYGDSGTTYRLENDLQYSVAAGPVNIQADFVFDGTNESSDGIDQFQVAGSGNFGPFSIGLGYQHTAGSAPVAAVEGREADELGGLAGIIAVPAKAAGPDSDQIGIGAGVTFGNYFVKGGYVSTEFDGDTEVDITTTVANFGGSFDSGMSFFIQAGEKETTFENDFFIGQILKDLGGGTQVYVEARSDNDHNGKDEDRTQVVVALSKSF